MEEGEFATAPTDLKVKTTVSFVTPPATVPPAIAPLVTARHATATQDTKGGAASAATTASHRWTATGCPAALCSPPRMKTKTRRAPLSRCLTPASLKGRMWAAQEERGGQEDGRRPGEESRGSQLWPGPVTEMALVRVNMIFLLAVSASFCVQSHSHGPRLE